MNNPMNNPMSNPMKLLLGATVLSLGVVGSVLVGAAPAQPDPAAASGELSAAAGEEEDRRLDAGEVLVRQWEPSDGTGVAAQARGVIEAPVAAVWPAVRDCGHFQEFMPRVVKSEVRARQGDDWLCYAELDMPWPIEDLQVETRSTIERLAGERYRRSWRLSKGSFERNSGSYQVEPFRGDPGRSLLTYTIDVKPNVPIPDSVLRTTQAKSLPEVFDRVARRVGAKPRTQ